MLSQALVYGMLFLGFNDGEVVTETHEITSIEGEIVRGEFVVGTGEGIYYTKEQFKEMGVEELEVGDVIDISWTQDNYENEEWDTIYSIELEESK